MNRTAFPDEIGRAASLCVPAAASFDMLSPARTASQTDRTNENNQMANTTKTKATSGKGFNTRFKTAAGLTRVAAGCGGAMASALRKPLPALFRSGLLLGSISESHAAIVLFEANWDGGANGGTLDLTNELVGQPTSGSAWGTVPSGG